jgi:pyruvate formate lyase activating enzyme
MEIKGFIETSLIEWEGKIASVVFLPFCNMRCRYCHAAHLVNGSSHMESIPRVAVLAYLWRQTGWLDGVVITGGEPTVHGEELFGLIRQVREIPLQVMIETNGTQPDCIAYLLEEGLLDAIAMDVKAPLTYPDYERVTGMPIRVEDVRRSMELIMASGLPYEFRITVAPGVVGADELRRMAPGLAGARRVAIQNFRPEHCLDSTLCEVMPYSADELGDFAAILRPHVGECIVRGRDRAVAVRSAAV